MIRDSLLESDFAKIDKKDGILSADNERVMKLKILKVFLLLAVVVIISRLFSLQISDFDKWQDWALKQHFEEIKIASERGPIIDRNGRYLAVSVPAGSIFVRPREIKNSKQVIDLLSKELTMSPQVVATKLQKKSPFIWIKRQIPREAAEKIAQYKVAGIGYVLESRRYYPYGSSAGTLVGKVGTDGNGLSGLEKAYEGQLHSPELVQKAYRDALGNNINVSFNNDNSGKLFSVPKGDELQVSLDLDLQTILEEELEKGKADNNAKSVMGVLVDSDSGEIVGLGQSPSLNPNFEISADQKSIKNLILETVYEPGSTMKPIVAALAIDEGVVSPATMINCEHGRFPFSKHIIKDVHPVDTVSLHEVIVRSSNIGMTKVGVRLGKEKLFDGLKSFGFGVSTKLSLPGESSGIFRSVSNWAPVDVATHSFGQGIAVTPLQMVRAMSAIVNGGEIVDLSLVNDGMRKNRQRIIKEKTAKDIQKMLYDVVEGEHGTGKLAKVQGVKVGGKTGTAQKARSDGRGYMSGKYMSSFLGFADASNIGVKQKFTLIVIVDEPAGGSIYGGAVAAPIFQKIIKRSLQVISTRNELDTKNIQKNMDGIVTAVYSNS